MAQLPAVAVSLWAAEVKQAYQQTQSRLRNAVTLRTGVKADIYNFRKMDAMAAIEWDQANAASGSGILPAAVGADGADYGFPDLPGKTAGHSKVACTPSNYVAHAYTDWAELTEINFDERRELATALAASINRRTDQLVLDALEGATGAAVGADGEKFDLDVLRTAKYNLDKNNVPQEGRTLVCHASAIYDMLGESNLTSIDYMNAKAIVDGRLDNQTLVGFNVIMVGDGTGVTSDAAGIADGSGSDTKKAYAFHKSAVGMAVGAELKTSLDFIPEKLSYLTACQFRAGAVAIDNNGIVEITHEGGTGTKT